MAAATARRAPVPTMRALQAQRGRVASGRRPSESEAQGQLTGQLLLLGAADFTTSSTFDPVSVLASAESR